ncbi:MAG: hypothetical protein ACTSWN_07260 [Promethearchaeota archaeon]
MGLFTELVYTLRMIWQAIIRNLKNDLKYKFRLLLNSLYTAINLALFTVIANVIAPKQGALPPEYYAYDSNMVNLAFMKFLFIGTYLWALYTRPFEDTVNCLPEETQKGTIGLLLTNNVNIKILLIGRFFASFIMSSILSTSICMPIFYMLGMLTIDTFYAIPLILLTLLCMTIFMLCVSLWVASFSLLFKKTGVLSNVFIYGLKVATGMYFPIFGLGRSTLLLESIPIACGIDFLRDLFIVGHPVAHGNAIRIGFGWQETIIYWELYVVICQVLGISLLIFIATFSIKVYVRKAKILGTIESY